MATFYVTVNRSYSTEVTVEAVDGEAAIDLVASRDFPLPPLTEWSGQKDWLFGAVDESGAEVAERE